MRKGEQHLIRMTRDAHMAHFLASDQASFINFAGDPQGRGGVSSRTGSYLRMSPKGGRMRYVPVSACVLHLVRCYLEGDRRSLIAAYEGEDLGTIFLSESTRNPGRPLAVGAFDEIIERVREKVGLPALTPHTLRHQRCTILKRAGVNLDDIALFAGPTGCATRLMKLHFQGSNHLCERS